MSSPSPHPPGCLCDDCLESAFDAPGPSAQPATFPRMPRAIAPAAPDSLAGEIQEVTDSLGDVDRRDRLDAPKTPPFSDDELARDIAAAAVILDCGRQDDEDVICRLSEMAPCSKCQQRIDADRLRSDLGLLSEDEYAAFVESLPEATITDDAAIVEHDDEPETTAPPPPPLIVAPPPPLVVAPPPDTRAPEPEPDPLPLPREPIPSPESLPAPVHVSVPVPATPPTPGTLNETLSGARADVAAAQNDLADMLAALRELAEATLSFLDDE